MPSVRVVFIGVVLCVAWNARYETSGTIPRVQTPGTIRLVQNAVLYQAVYYRCSQKIEIDLNGLTTLGAAVWMAVCVMKAAQAVA